MVTQDIFFLEEGSPTMIEEGYNVFKLKKLSALKLLVKEYQSVPFSFEKNFNIQHWIKSYNPLEEDALYDISLKFGEKAKTIKKK